MSLARLAMTLATATLCLDMAACDAGRSVVVPSRRIVTESRPVHAFTAISVSLPGEVVLRTGPLAPVRVEADDNLMGMVETVVEEGSLKLRFRRPIAVNGPNRLRLTVTSPPLATIELAGTAHVVAENFKVGDLAVSIAGPGEVKFGLLDARNLRLDITGSGVFRADGKAEELKARIAGSGGIDASGLQTRRATIATAGSGAATVWATESLSASIAGSGDIRYRGNPEITRNIVGSGDVRRAFPDR